jgi:hypothetical protein
MPKPLRLLFCLLLATVAAAQTSAPASPDKPDFAARVAGLAKRDGFLPYYWDEKKGELLFELSPAALGRQFIYYTAMGSGVGSINMMADRSSFARSQVCRLRRVGPRVLVVAENTSFRAENGSPALRHSIASSFPSSVLAALPIEAEQDGTLLVQANPLMVRDAADLLSQLRRPSRAVGGRIIRQTAEASANWHLDEARSVIDLDDSGSFPLNTEVEALLTFSTDGENDLNQPDPHSLSVREHHSFVALPPPGYEPREADPRVGFFGPRFQDFSRPFDQPLDRYLISRWRLQKKDPNAAVSEPVKPLVFYLDPAIPEPVRSAARRGALWWNQAFEQAGFKNALRVEDLPEDASPLDIRYPTIQWTSRAGRGWSVGMSHDDPRTGEILHSVVQLDSHRMRTADNYWTAMVPAARTSEQALDAFAGLDNLDPKTTAEQVMENRLALLTCHEMGHVLGLDHNFVASTYDRGSVMDYFAPRVKIRTDGSADLSDAYMQGTGSYDRFAVEWGYSQGRPGASPAQERARLNAIVDAATAKGIVWGNYDDPRWNSYDDGPDPVAWLKQVMPVRDALLAQYGPRMLRPGEPVSDLAARFPLVYLFHRYALGAAVNVVGSAKIPLMLAGDPRIPIEIWPAQSQKEALRLLFQALRPTELAISPELWKALAPPPNREASPESFTSTAGYVFSPADGARSVAEIVAGGLLDPERMERLAVIARQDPNAPGPADVVNGLIEAGFGEGVSPEENDLAAAVRSEIAEHLIALAANSSATPEVQAAALAGVRQVQSAAKKNASDEILRRLDREIDLFLSNPSQNMPKVTPSGAPPGPPV